MSYSVIGDTSEGGLGSTGIYQHKNVLINGNLDIWQRSAGASISASSFGPDRWYVTLIGSTGAFSRQPFTSGQNGMGGQPQNYFRAGITAASTGNGYTVFTQFIESVWTLQGRAATLSFWAKADVAKNIAVEFIQMFGTSGSPSIDAIGVTTIPLTTAWQRFAVKVNIPSVFGKVLGTDQSDRLQLNIWLDAGPNNDFRTNGLGHQSGTFDFAQFQLEEGSVASDYEKRSAAEELTLCQRYYEKGESGYFSGDVTNTKPYSVCVPFKVTKRGLTLTTGQCSAVYVSAIGFPNTAPSVSNAYLDGMIVQSTSNATTTGAYFSFSWAVNAEF